MLAVARHCSRVLIVHEDSRTGGIGESLAAIIQEEAFESLDAPVRIVGALDTPVPYSPPLEEFFLPSEADIERAARLLVATDASTEAGSAPSLGVQLTSLLVSQRLDRIQPRRAQRGHERADEADDHQDGGADADQLERQHQVDVGRAACASSSSSDRNGRGLNSQTST